MSIKLKRILIGLSVVVVVGFVAVWWLLFTPAYTPNDATFSTPQEREQVTMTLEEKLAQFQATAPQPQPPPGQARLIQVPVSQREANAMLQTMLEKEVSRNAKLREAGLVDPAIAFEDDRVILVAKVEHSGMRLPVTMTVDLALGPNSTLNYSIRGFQVGRIGLPDDVRARIEREVSGSFGQKGTLKLPEGITGLKVANGQVILEGIAR